MELLRGMTLGEELHRSGPLALERACALVRQIATGLAAAHSAGIVHRDLKPDNIFLVAQSNAADLVKILDFGVSKIRRRGDEVDLTRTGTVIGTPTYMAPEQAEGARTVDARADIWSLGVIFYKMITGELPFTAPSYPRLVIKIVTEAPQRVRARRPDVPHELERIVHRCLEKVPGDRYPSATSLLAELAEIDVKLTASAGVNAGDALARTRIERPSGREPTPVPARAGIAMTPTTDDLPFDEVVLDGARRLPAAAFLEMPLSERISRVIARTVSFIRGGVEVDRHAALARLRTRNAR
jgi:serine/threonine-protein kinase